MKRFLGYIFFCIFVSSAFFVFPNRVNSQFQATGDILHSMRCQGQPLNVPTWQYPQTGEGDIMIDNFEYWDSPHNHGWKLIEPPYPVFGFGIGYSILFNTVLDVQAVNRVLDVYRPSTVFLINTPYEKLGVYHDLYTPPLQGISSGINYINLDTHPVLSFKFRAPFGIEPWDMFELEVMGSSKAGNSMNIKIRPIQPQYGTAFNGGNSTEKMGGYQASIIELNGHGKSMVIEVNIGRNYFDGSWHVVWLDLKEVVEVAIDTYSGDFGMINKSDWEIAQAHRVLLSGRMFRMDNICFRLSDHKRLDQPDFFECGPRYAQIFEPYRYLFMADYEADSKLRMLSDLLLDPNNFLTEPDQIRMVWIEDLLRVEPDYHIIDSNHPLYDPNYSKRWMPGDPNFGLPDPVAARYIAEDFFIDMTLPVLADSNYRLGGAQRDIFLNHGMLGWNMTVNGYGENAIQAFMIQPLPINPYDGMPTYIPSYYRTIEVIHVYGKPHYGPAECFILESALWNTGVRKWPNIIYMDYEPQYFEDLIVTLQVTNGHNSDTRTFPISVVNYPVENYPPVTLLHTTNRITYVGKTDEYALRFADPDCFIFSIAKLKGREPATSHVPGWPYNEVSPYAPPQHIRTDQDNLVYRMTLNGLPYYQYGPWMQDIIDPHTSLITITPRFEGAFEAVVYCTDDKGAVAFGDFTYYTFSPGTWLNHPPINFGNPTRPILARAGEEIILNYPDLKVMDPDGDEMFATANLGAIGRTADGGFMWSFQTNFPGTYLVELIFYDIRGGYIIIKMTVEVKPWWAY